ncbi:MAG: hypothetical protein HY431_02795 [Candidatus Levybacteria bacterium]|nr:hypothetical protein [Candidatus Levybacteria bacterium]
MILRELYADADSFFFTQNPNVKAFRTPDTAFIVIKSNWVRTLDPTVTPPKVEESSL